MASMGFFDLSMLLTLSLANPLRFLSGVPEHLSLHLYSRKYILNTVSQLFLILSTNVYGPIGVKISQLSLLPSLQQLMNCQF